MRRTAAGPWTGWADSEDSDCAAGGFCCSFEALRRGRPYPHPWPGTPRSPSGRQAGAL